MSASIRSSFVLRRWTPRRADTSRPRASFVIDTADVPGEVLEERSNLTPDMLVGDQPVVTDHWVGDGYLCACMFDHWAAA